MPLELRGDLPADLSDLACLVGDSSQPQERRCQALELLVPAIEAIARQVAPRIRKPCRGDLIAESRSLIWSRIDQFDPDLGRFEDWCRTVLHNYSIDLWRRSNRGPVKPAAGGDAPDAALQSAVAIAPDDRVDEAIEVFRQLRAVLDRIAWPASREVHYYAVLLLQLRLAVARRLTPEPLDGDDLWRSELPELIDWLVPWHPDENSACIKAGWPSLAELWSAYCGAIRDSGLRIEAPRLSQVVGRLLPPPAQLTPDVWNHWVHRAKREARRRVQDDGVWTRCFNGLLPDR